MARREQGRMRDRGPLKSRHSQVIAAALLGLAVLLGLQATGRIGEGSDVWFFVELAEVAAVTLLGGVAAYRQSDGSGRLLLLSPYPFAAATWLILFALRPLQLYFSPGEAAISLAEFGFRLSDLQRTVALGGLGAAAWLGGYLAGLGCPRERRGEPREAPLTRISAVGAALALGVGTLLWLALFQRQGGLSALLHSASSIRVNQTSSFYAFVGIWLVQGTVLYALAVRLRSRGASGRGALFLGCIITLLAAVALELRGLAAFTALSALLVYASLRPIRRTHVVVAAVALVPVVLALGVTQQIRAYSAIVSTREAVRLTLKTPLPTMYSSDLNTFDNFVAMRQLVPDSVSYLGGRTIVEIPAAFVPRSLWSGKPTGIDFLAASYLYPGVYVGIPLTVQGELYWNGGMPFVIAGSLILGLLFGLLARAGLGSPPGSGRFVLYAAAVPFTHAFLTRGLATMAEGLAFAMIGTAGAVYLLSRRWNVPWRRT